MSVLLALAVALASMGLYALFGGRKDADAERRGSQFLLGVGDFLVHWFMWVLSPLERLSLRLGLTPDFFNFAGLALGLASGVAIAAGRLELGGWAIALGGICDIMDGRVARATRRDSLYGKFIDSTLDRYVEVFALLGFAIYLRASSVGPALAAAALAGSLLVSYTRARGESLGVVCREGLMQRAERLVLTCLVAWLDPPLARRGVLAAGTLVTWTLALITAGTFVTAVHRTVWISRRLRRAPDPGGAGSGPAGGVRYTLGASTPPSPRRRLPPGEPVVESATSTRVLVIDDDPDIRALLAMILGEAGYEVTLADGGRAALAALEGGPPALVFLDLNMPEVDGWAVLDHLETAAGPSPPVIVVSGGAGRSHGGPLGRCVMGFLPKPFRVDDVLETAQRTLTTWGTLEPRVFEERRAARRRPLMLDARLLSKEGLPLALGKILDLSAHGAQLDLGASLRPGNTVRLTFEIPGLKGPILLEGRVQWRNSGTMGLSFVDLPPEHAARLNDILAEA